MLNGRNLARAMLRLFRAVERGDLSAEDALEVWALTFGGQRPTVPTPRGLSQKERQRAKKNARKVEIE